VSLSSICISCYVNVPPHRTILTVIGYDMRPYALLGVRCVVRWSTKHLTEGWSSATTYVSVLASASSNRRSLAAKGGPVTSVFTALGPLRGKRQPSLSSAGQLLSARDPEYALSLAPRHATVPLKDASGGCDPFGSATRVKWTKSGTSG